ncbi:MAG: YdcF family protein [Ilumatobacter sp.]|nr:MAG: YdcF family protein [Ilumatobacter sp.]
MSDDLWAATVPATSESSPSATEVLPVVDRPVATPPRRRRGRSVVRVLLAVALVGVGYFGVSLFQVWNTGRASQAREVDAIVVLGAAQYDGRPSPQLQARLDEVLRLWPEGIAPLVVVTGGQQPGDRFTEAEASARYLVERGVPESAIVFENEGTSTFESLESTAAILADRGLDRVLLVTDPFHSLRSRLIAQEVGMEAYVAPTSTSVVTGPRSAALHLKEAGGVAVGRLIGFGRLSVLTG